MPSPGRVLAIDPDPDGGSYVLFDSQQGLVDYGWREHIQYLCSIIHLEETDQVVVENLQCYGMPAGASMFETAKAIGEIRGRCRWVNVPFDDSLARPKIKAALCHSAKAKDANVRAALIDLYGGDKRTAVGLKASPGPLYGIKRDVWAALALAVVWLSLQGLGPLARRDGLLETV